MSFYRIPYKNGNEWLILRNKGIGGSDCSSIIGENPYKTNVQLYLEKIGQIKQRNIKDKPQIVYGKKAEKYLRNLFKLDYPKYTVKHTKEILVSNHYDFIRGSLDGELFEKSTGKKGILEIKTTEILSSYQKERWNNGVPQNYYCQILYYLYITGWDFAILHVQMKYEKDGQIWTIRRTYRFERNEVLEDMKYLIKNVVKFWENNITKKILPSLIIGNF